MADLTEGRLGSLVHSNVLMSHDRLKEESLKSNRRGKPHVEIYRPGSGPLRKSVGGVKPDDDEDDGMTDVNAVDPRSTLTIPVDASKIHPAVKLASSRVKHQNIKLKYLNNVEKNNKSTRKIHSCANDAAGCDNFNADKGISDHGTSGSGGDASGSLSDKDTLISKRKQKKPDTPLYSIKTKHRQALQIGSMVNNNNRCNFSKDINERLRKSCSSNSKEKINCNSNNNNNSTYNDSNNNFDKSDVPASKDFLDEIDKSQNNHEGVDQCTNNYHSSSNYNKDKSHMSGCRYNNINITEKPAFVEINGRKSKQDKRKRRGKGGGTGRSDDIISHNLINGSTSLKDERKEYILTDENLSMSLLSEESACSPADDICRVSSGVSMVYRDKVLMERRSCSKVNENNSRQFLPYNHRQSSKPCSLTLSSDNCRVRDTKSVEPSDPLLCGDFKIDNHSLINRYVSTSLVKSAQSSVNHRTISSAKLSRPSFDSLPPRLQRKYIAENGFTHNLTYVGKSASGEDQWDGSSVTFQGANPYSNPSDLYSFSNNHCASLPLPLTVDIYDHINQPSQYSQMVGSSVFSRGRGRFTPETLKDFAVSRYSTADCDPVTSSLAVKEKEQENWDDDCDSNECNDGDGRSLNLINIYNADNSLTDSLDWVEEVERSEKMQRNSVDRNIIKNSNRDKTADEEDVNSNCKDSPLLPFEGKKRREGRRRRKSMSQEQHNRHAGEHHLMREKENHCSSLERCYIVKGGGVDRRSRETNQYLNTKTAGRDGVKERRDNRCRPRRTSCGSVSNSDEKPSILSSASAGDFTNSSGSGQDQLQQPGILILPSSVGSKSFLSAKEVPDIPTYPAYRGNVQRHLFNPKNPSEPIIVAAGSRVIPANLSKDGSARLNQSCQQQNIDSSGIAMRNPSLLVDIEKCEYELMFIINTGQLIQCWSRVCELRNFLQEALQVLLLMELKFCQANNVEQCIWKLLFYNIIEHLRKAISDDPQNAQQYKQLITNVIDDGMKYYESLLGNLESQHKIKFDDFLQSNPDCTKGLGYVGLAIVCAQKLFLFVGDLARYKEQINEGSNYGLARQWYIKAQQINPKNGRPYNQLALLAIYARRKLDAVYYYMRSLMSSNPVQSARESLLSLFDENRKKYDITEKKRKEEREKERERASEKEELVKGRYRREVWIHPVGGKQVLTTTSSISTAVYDDRSEEELLTNMSYLSLNKRFGVSYLHAHGKLFTKVGMDTFQETAVQMLKEFRALLQHSPLPLSCNRLLQLVALNMFSIENTQLIKSDDLDPGYRSAKQECALILSLQMFNLILERCIQLLKQPVLNISNESGLTEDDNSRQAHTLVFTSDVLALLPAVKVWCDWLLCHSTVWNPPPSCHDYRVGPAGDAWSRLAMLVNILEGFSRSSNGTNLLSTVQRPDSELVRLPEDVVLSGFTPLMSNTQDPIYTNKYNDMDAAQLWLRIKKILFFGSIFLCGVDPPVLKLHKFESGRSEYVSFVEIQSPPIQSDSDSDSDVRMENEMSDERSDDYDCPHQTQSQQQSTFDEDVVSHLCQGVESVEDIQSLLHRKQLLERSHRKQERQRRKVQEILKECDVTVEMEVRPHYLIPDTNCFIDYLPQLMAITKAVSPSATGQQHLYTLMVPLVVLNELEGLSKGARGNSAPLTRSQHSALLAEAARNALEFLRSGPHPAIRCVTTRGNTLTSSTFTAEEDTDQDMKNDDRILSTSLNLSRLSCRGGEVKSNANKDGETYNSKSGPRRVFSEVVLLTEDRNLKVKALARDMPVSDMPHFMKWSGLGLDVESDGDRMI